MNETSNSAVGSRRVCTEEMVAEVVADLIADGNVSRVDGKTPSIAQITNKICERYDGLRPSVTTLTRHRNKIMAERIAVVSDREMTAQLLAALPTELTDLLDQRARQEQVMLGQLANALAGVLQRTSDELGAKLRVAVEQAKHESAQATALAEEEVTAAITDNMQLRDHITRLTAERDAARAEAAAERARAATFEQVNAALLAQLNSASAPVCADVPAGAAEHDQTAGLPTPPTPDSPVDGTPIAGEQTEIRKPRKDRPRATSSSIEKEAA